jgi:hypothetical protein
MSVLHEIVANLLLKRDPGDILLIVPESGHPAICSSPVEEAIILLVDKDDV